MDESVRSEYQRRLDAGDRSGALEYLRMLRTQTSDPAARDAYTQAIDGIEGTSSGYGGSAGPFGDNSIQWADQHPARPSVAANPGAPDFGGPSFGPSQPQGPPAPPVQTAPGGLAGAIAGAGGFLGGRVEHAFENVTGGPHHPAQAQTPPPEAQPTPQHGGGLGGGIADAGGFLGGRVEHAFENVTGGPHHPAQAQTPPPEAAASPPKHGLNIFGHQFDEETPGPGSESGGGGGGESVV